jgi:hypothetical protein
MQVPPLGFDLAPSRCAIHAGYRFDIRRAEDAEVNMKVVKTLTVALVLAAAGGARAQICQLPSNTPIPVCTSTPTAFTPTPIPPTPTATRARTATAVPTKPPPTSTPNGGGGTVSSSGGWLMVCPPSHDLPDDPIVFPNQPGASHLHVFLGNTTADADSTYASMTFNSQTTTCPVATGDTSGYWVMALYKNGVQIDPKSSYAPHTAQFYYRKDNLKAGTVIQSFPAGLKMIAGNGHATSVADNPYLGRELYYGCSDNSESGKPTAPIKCSTGYMSLHIGFPNCWDGVNLDSPDHKSHMAYPSSGVCPTDHPVALPRVIYRFEYPVGTDSSGITLASGPTYTVHADFWNTWDQTDLDGLVQNCLNKSVNCGTFK